MSVSVKIVVFDCVRLRATSYIIATLLFALINVLFFFYVQSVICRIFNLPEMEPGRPGHGSRVTGSPGQHFGPGRVGSRVSVQYT